jgi:hypothetical protein
MRATSPTGVVIFTGDKERLARFYEAVTGLPVRVKDDSITVMGSDGFQVVIHALHGEPPGDASREWVVKLEAKPKYAMSSTRKDFPWTNNHHLAGDLRAGYTHVLKRDGRGVESPADRLGVGGAGLTG